MVAFSSLDAVAEMGNQHAERGRRVQVVGVHDDCRTFDRVPRRQDCIGGATRSSLYREYGRDPGPPDRVQMGAYPRLDIRPHHDHRPLDAGLRCAL